ncbi:histidine phosphatase family protein [Sphaerisporangium sp. TRM90804]|uniref:histidine phosphatase family protein n=1 Tax=Sphaerisporangium sp. TRM90804 TaxID=3031113 RepID=UPI00244C58F7|nr:histidine phosphatase family protein [Sphaerisporangium sp. TRM90804]MDH2424883.1 histidine phosphatase family protein [Sphaerisporangium sp. TRM90804]
MLFIRHATTPGMRSARFPADERADPASLARAATLTGLLTTGAAPVHAAAPAGSAEVIGGPDEATRAQAAWVAPVRAATETAEAMGLVPRAAPALGEADAGRWRGLPYDRVARREPEELARWLADPEAAPHGGESLAALAVRVGAWLESVRDEPAAVAVCDAGAIRAALGHALGLDPRTAARFDIAPLSTTELTVTRDGWRVAHVNRKVIPWSPPTRSAPSSDSAT